MQPRGLASRGSHLGRLALQETAQFLARITEDGVVVKGIDALKAYPKQFPTAR